MSYKKTWIKGAISKGLALLLVGASMLAQAGEGSMGWVYTLDLQPKGTLEFEQRLSLVRGQAQGSYDLWQSRTELEYGVTNDFQLAGYLNYYKVNAGSNDITGDTTGLMVPGAAATNGTYSKTLSGYSVEGIWRLSNPVVSPVGAGLYLEYTGGQLKRDLEGRLLLQSNFLDDKLVTAANIVAGSKRMMFDAADQASESELDLLLGVTYRFANRWTAGVEYRYHNDFVGYRWRTRTQEAHFFGPNLHYADKDWWFTMAWRYQIKGECFADGVAECSKGYAWDGHGRNEYVMKFGFPF